MVEIVKVQIPLAASKDARVLPLVYDKLRKRISHQSLDPAALKSIGYDVKAFFEAEWVPLSRQWKLGQRVPSQLW